MAMPLTCPPAPINLYQILTEPLQQSPVTIGGGEAVTVTIAP